MELQAIINRGLELGLTELEIYCSDTLQKTIKIQNGSLDTLNIKKINSFSVRGKYNGKMGYYYIENPQLDDIDGIINKIILNASTITSSEEEILFDGLAKYKEIEPRKANFDEFTNIEKIEMLKKIEQGIKEADSRILTISPCQFVESSTEIRIVNSKGLNLEKEVSYMYVYVAAMASNGTDNTMGYSIKAEFDLRKLNIEEIVSETVEKAISALGAGKIKSGSYPIVFHRSVTSEIIEAFSSVFSSERALRKMTKLIGKEGEKIFGDNITIIDNPFDTNATIMSAFDDEGVPCEETEIVKNGVFNTFLYNLKTAKHFNKKSTGNGFRAGSGSNITVSNTNLCLVPGVKSVEDLISSVDNGIYVTEISGLHAGLDPISGDFNVQSSGFIIEDGKITSPVTLFVISGNFFDMLNNVEEIANNIEKNYIDTAAPAIKIKSLMVSGE